MPPAESARTPTHVTAAFARMTDAHYALGILDRCGLAPLSVSLETVNDGRGGVAMVLLRIDVDPIDHSRAMAAISGGHGVPVPDPTTFEGRSEWVA